MKNQHFINILCVLVIIGSSYHVMIEDQDVDSLLVTLKDTDGTILSSTNQYVQNDGQLLAELKIPDNLEPGEYVLEKSIDDGYAVHTSREEIKLIEKEKWWKTLLSWIRALFP